MKRILAFSLALLLAVGLFPLGVAADDSAAVAQKAAEIREKYGIGIEYPTDASGTPIITVNSLITLDTALETLTPGVVRQVSGYYQNKNGRRITYSYVQSHGTSNAAGQEVLLGGFDPATSLIELYMPTTTAYTLTTGENPITIVHEFGHALHLMYCDRYGLERMRQEWTAFNGGIAYSEANIASSPNTSVFVTGYAATMFEEDVAEVIGHVFVRNSAGQGFHNKLSQNGSLTGLGRKVAYVEQMITNLLDNTDQAVANYRKIYSTPTSINYQGMNFSGDYLQFAGYPQPRYVLNGTLNTLGKTKASAIWIRALGGWYVQEPTGAELIVFPGGAWTDVPAGFVPPRAAA